MTTHEITEASLAPENISLNALKVVRRLNGQGYQAYLVGGSVRDLMLGHRPKDFDVATNARPDQVRELFRNSRSIGKRFKIVHVRFDRDIIEVATFRAGRANSVVENEKGEGNESHTHEIQQSESGMLIVDNVYGTIEEDVFRRDFTINALYYDTFSNALIDLVDGKRDLKSHTLRLIGDPESRYREDPVRMLRAVRFKALLDFKIEDLSAQPIHKLGYLLQDISSARLFEELLKLLMTGCAAQIYEQLKHFELFGWLFPDSQRTMAHYPADELIKAVLESTDRRVSEGLPVTPAFIYAALLWYPFVNEKKRLEKEGSSHIEANNEASNNVLAKQQLFTSIPRRFSVPMRDIWYLQFRLSNRFGKKAEAILKHKRFRAAYDFLLLREQAGEKLNNLGEWWTLYQNKDEAERLAMGKKGKRRKHRSKP